MRIGSSGCARRRIAFGSAALCAWAALAVTAQAGPRYTDPERRFSFLPPVGWKRASEDVPKDAVAFVGPMDGEFAPNVTLTGEPVGDVTLDRFVAGARALPAQIKGVTILNEKRTTLGGKPAYLWRLRLTFPNKPVVENRQVFCVVAKRAYVLTFSAQPEKMKRYEATLHRLLVSFQWEKG